MNHKFKVINNKKFDKLPSLLTKDQVKEYLKISESTLWRIRRQGKLTPLKILGKILFDEQDIINFLNQA